MADEQRLFWSVGLNPVEAQQCQKNSKIGSDRYEFSFRWQTKTSEMIAGISAAILALLILSGFETVESYETCLVTRNGQISGKWQAGLHWQFPVGSDVSCYKTARTTYEASPGERGGGADYNEPPVDARTVRWPENRRGRFRTSSRDTLRNRISDESRIAARKSGLISAT